MRYILITQVTVYRYALLVFILSMLLIDCACSLLISTLPDYRIRFCNFLNLTIYSLLNIALILACLIMLLSYNNTSIVHTMQNYVVHSVQEVFNSLRSTIMFSQAS